MIATAITVSGWYWGWWPSLAGERLSQAGGLVAQIGATMMGFVLAMIAIMATFGAFRLGRNMQRTGHFKVLLSLMTLTAVAFLVVTALGTAVSVWDGNVVAHVRSALLWVSMWSTALLIDSIYKLFRVISLLKPD